MSIRRPDGRPLVQGVNLLFDALDASRYFYPEPLKLARGCDQWRPELAGTHLGYSMDLCYDTSLLAQGRRVRGGACDWATDFGNITDIDWDDPRSAFRGLHRGTYFQPADIDNAAGPGIWYTDPFGRNASTTPFPGSIRQVLSPRQVRYSDRIGGRNIDPRVAQRWHDDGGGTVHAPN